MNRFRKVNAQEVGRTLSPTERANIESEITDFPLEFRSEIYKEYGRNINPAKVTQLFNDLIAKIENYDKTFQSVRTFYNENMPNDFTTYLDEMHKKYNVHDYIAAKFFNDAWNIYKAKFSSTNGFSELFDQLKETYGPNIPMALSQLKALIDKLPSALGRVENEESFINIIIKLAKDPTDPAINKLYEQFVINEFIRDLILGKSDEKLMAANVVDSKTLIKEIGRSDSSSQTDVQKQIKDNYTAYNTFIDKTFDSKMQLFKKIIKDKNRLYKNLANDIIKNGITSDGMRIIYENLYNAQRLQGRLESIFNVDGPPPLTPNIEDKK